MAGPVKGTTERRRRTWTERQFENWLIRQGQRGDGGELIPGERLILLSRQRALRRVVDLLLLDESGGLVLVEVKNETSSRTVIGQALEYLSQYEDAELGTLLDDFNIESESAAELAGRIAEAGIKEITRKRRIVIAAPAFDFATQASVSLLNGRLNAADLSVHLVAVTRAGRGFTTALLSPDKPRAISQLRGTCGLNPRGRLFFVLPAGPNNLVLNLGRLSDGHLNRPKGPTATQRLVRQRAGSLVPYQGEYEPDVTELGSVWRHRTRPRRAIGLVRVRDGKAASGQLVYFALEEEGKLIGYRIRTAVEFRKWYSRESQSSLDWMLLLDVRLDGDGKAG